MSCVVPELFARSKFIATHPSWLDIEQSHASMKEEAIRIHVAQRFIMIIVSMRTIVATVISHCHQHKTIIILVLMVRLTAWR